MKKIALVSLGCAKNQVDSEAILALFKEPYFKITSSLEEADAIIINTCGFILSAKKENIDTILDCLTYKKKTIVVGCLVERYFNELKEAIPEVDLWIPFKDEYTKLPGLISKMFDDEIHLPSFDITERINDDKAITYLKIAEGCNKFCAYCAIPIMTGRHSSRPVDEILEEVKWLVAGGTKEFQVIAQELTYYGVDIDGKQHIAELIDRMADIPGVEWIRLHYAYPARFPWDLLGVMARRPNVCKYLDIALQHISDRVLARMHRNVTKAETYALIERIRREVPGIHLRTTLMVGFPGETDDDFEELMEFTRWARFERMGAFAYSEEDGTYSAEHYADDVPQEVKQRRLDALMALQQDISAEVEARKVGKVLKVVVDRLEGDYYVARSEFCSPEVDPEVLIPASERSLDIGCFYDVKVTGAEEFDIYATTQLD